MIFAIHKPLLLLAGLFGAAGVALAAAGSHLGGVNIEIAANFLLFHAPALIGFALLGRNRVALVAGYVLALGVALFCGDLVMRAQLFVPLFPMAAPIGGTTMILGWVGLAFSALAGWQESND